MSLRKIILLKLNFLLLVVFLINACSLPYPAEKRVLIPRFFDQDYKNFKKLAEEETGRVLYARPILDSEKDSLRSTSRIFKINPNTIVQIHYIYTATNYKSEYKYICVGKFGYYWGWRKWTFNFFIVENTSERIYTYPIEGIKLEEAKQKAVENKSIIGRLKPNYNRNNNGLLWFEVPSYLENLDESFDGFKVYY